MGRITELPPEVLVQIFETCHSFTDALALSSTCRRLHSVWDVNGPSVIWRLGQRDIPCFEDALIAVRSTAIVTEHFANRLLPPHPLPLASLKSQAQKPSACELGKVFDMQHLVRCIHLKRCLSMSRNCQDRQVCYSTGRWCDHCNERAENVYRSYYRLLIISAALSSVYHEPMLLDNPGRPSVLGTSLYDPDGRGVGASAENISAYFMRFPAYRIGAYGDYDEVFGPLTEFLVQASKDRARCVSKEDERCMPGGSNLEHSCRSSPITEWLSKFKQPADPMPWETFLFSEITQTLSALEGMRSNSVFTSLSDKRATRSFRPPTGFEEHRDMEKRRTTIIIDPRSYYPRGISTPVSLVDVAHNSVKDTYQCAKHCDRDTAATALKPESLESRLNQFWRHSGQPNHIRSHWPLPKLNLQFYEYVLRKYLNIRFSDSAFQYGYAVSYNLEITDQVMLNHPWDLNVEHLSHIFAGADVPFANSPYHDDGW
ncbi:hypothetical protein BDV06DRAFT_227983 [Aspergillus oleicola]